MLASALPDAFGHYLDQSRKLVVFELDNLENMLKALNELDKADHDLVLTVLGQMSVKIGGGIKSDIGNLKNNSDSFNNYMKRLADFYEVLVAPIVPSYALLTDFRNRKTLIDQASTTITRK